MAPVSISEANLISTKQLQFYWAITTKYLNKKSNLNHSDTNETHILDFPTQFVSSIQQVFLNRNKEIYLCHTILTLA